MNSDAPETAKALDTIAYNLLKGAKALGVFPTPVDRIVAEAELSIDRGVDLSRIEPSFLERFGSGFSRTMKKFLGICDIRQKVIYLDHSQKESRNNFITLHETIHGVSPWQRDLLAAMDDEQSLNPDVKEIFEREANYGASSLLFQLHHFDDEAAKLPLTIKSPQALAQKFGGSAHAAIRRYVQRSAKRCAVLVLHPPQQNGQFGARFRNYFQSDSFTAEFGDISWPDFCTLPLPFVSDLKFNRRFHEKGKILLLTIDGSLTEFEYHFFNNTFNAFVFILPKGERIRSRVRIVSAEPSAA